MVIAKKMDASPYYNKKKLMRLCDVRIETQSIKMICGLANSNTKVINRSMTVVKR